MEGFLGGHGHGSHGDLFDMLNGGGGGGFGGFGGGGGGGLFSMLNNQRRRPRKGESTVQPLPVTLEDLYKGKTTKLQLTKKVLCKGCNGVGGKAGSVKPCDRCRGSGKVFVTRQIGPGMIQQMAARCDECAGEGEKCDAKDRCKKCDGKKTAQEQKIIEVQVEPGMRENQKIVFYGEGDQEPGIEPGDIILVVKTKHHERFERKGDDLFMKQTVTLKEALCGFTVVVPHLDGRNLALAISPGDVIQPDSIRGALGEGMPVPGSEGQRGNLYLLFDIVFPPNHFLASPDHYKKLESLLPRPSPAKLPVGDHTEEVTLGDFDPRRYQHHAHGGGGAREAYDEEESDDDIGGPSGQHGGVQCAQQ
jgi:DnaJ family protein A protein 2